MRKNNGRFKKWHKTNLKPRKSLVCLECGIKFHALYPHDEDRRKFHSRKCFEASSRRPENKRIGKDCPNWKGGISASSHGYLMLTSGKYARKQKLHHRFVMEQHLGRLLDSSEIVHHINGDKKDNRIENLEIMTRAEHIKEHRPRRKYPKLPKKERDAFMAHVRSFQKPPANIKKCSMSECDRFQYAKTFCQKHYIYARKHRWA